MAPFDDPEFLNPDQRLPLCLNRPGARSHLPLTLKMTELAMAGLSKTQMFEGIKAAFAKKPLPLPEPGSMCYMMSKQQYFGRKYGNADPHLMFWFPKTDDMFWGGGFPGSPVYVHQYSPEPISPSSGPRPAIRQCDGPRSDASPPQMTAIRVGSRVRFFREGGTVNATTLCL